ncbi:MAG: hypothetical protein IKA64_00395 [Clostridia bacterium]|nr:hypothetical protein [Clostridia bacterium]
MDFRSVYFYVYIALLLLCSLFAALGVFVLRGGRLMKALSAVLHIPMLVMLFLAGGELEWVLLSLLFVGFCYTLAAYIFSRRAGT